MSLRPDEIGALIEKELKKYQKSLEMEDVGVVLRVGDSIAVVYGLHKAMASELVEFPNGLFGTILNLEENVVGVAIFGEDTGIKEGDLVKRTGRIASVPVGEELLGRVINPLGQPLDGKGPIGVKKYGPVEARPPNVIHRQPVKEPLMTGLKAVDSMIPIGRGQRELIIADRQTGKTAIVIDTIVNQRESDVYCIYVSVGQKVSNVAAVLDSLEKQQAMNNTIVIVASSDEPASLLYLAPYAGCAIAEEFMNQGKHTLVIYDDLTKHAQAYRQLALLLRRPPGREAYPGDIFYLHSRLLERAAKLSDDKGGGSLTALPIVETQTGDISSYIPTNVISITDGQIYLEPDLFYAGIRPAINVGLSVSRVGSNAQFPAMKKVGGRLRLDLAQYREMATFAQFGTELDKATQKLLVRGERLTEVLKQGQYSPLPLWKQVVIIFAGTQGYLDDLPVAAIEPFEQGLYPFIDSKYPDIAHNIQSSKELTEETEKVLHRAVKEYTQSFKAEYEEKCGKAGH